MLHTFVDESYARDHYYVGGIVLTPAQLRQLEDTLTTLKKSVIEKFPTAGRNGDPELHAHRIMRGVGEWDYVRGRVHESVWVCRSVIHAVVNCGGRVHIQGVDVVRLHARYRYPDSPYRIGLRRILEEVNDHCERLGEEATVTADMPGDSYETESAVKGYLQSPTSKSKSLARIIHPIQYVDYCDSLGIQAADVVTYVLRRYLEETKTRPKARKAARQMFNAIKPNLDSYGKWLP